MAPHLSAPSSPPPPPPYLRWWAIKAGSSRLDGRNEPADDRLFRRETLLITVPRGMAAYPLNLRPNQQNQQDLAKYGLKVST